MPRKPTTIWLVYACLATSAGCDTPAHTTQQALARPATGLSGQIAKRPVPDLATLARRSRPDQSERESGASFLDILKLREVGDREGVPVLANILDLNAGSGRIHGYAAAQALFLIGGEEAHAVLRRHLLDPTYLAREGIFYTFWWDMDPAHAADFIEDYHLQTLSNDLVLSLEVSELLDEAGQHFEFALKLHNSSDGAYVIEDSQQYRGLVLTLRNAQGRFVRSFQTLELDAPPPELIELKPDHSHGYRITTHVTLITESQFRHPTLSDDSTLFMGTHDVAYDVRQPGRFEVFALVEAPPRERSEGDSPRWSGRVVSQPVSIEILKPAL